MKPPRAWSRTQTGTIWVPGPTRRTILSGAIGGGAALLLGCGNENGVTAGSGGAGGGGSGGIDAGAGGAGGAGGIDAGGAAEAPAVDASDAALDPDRPLDPEANPVVYSNAPPAAPGTPFLLFDPMNVDNYQDMTVLDGGNFAPWLNQGSTKGDGQDPAAPGHLVMAQIGEPGKLNNLPAALGDGATTILQTPAFASSVSQPITYAAVIKITTANLEMIWAGGSLGTNGHQIFHSVGGALQINAHTHVAPGLTLKNQMWHALIITVNGAASYARLDGTEVGPFNTGSDPLGSLCLMGNLDDGLLVNGGMAIFAAWNGSIGTHPDRATIYSWLQDRFGSGFPQ